VFFEKKVRHGTSVICKKGGRASARKEINRWESREEKPNRECKEAADSYCRRVLQPL
jgi:hypothetical protein